MLSFNNVTTASCASVVVFIFSTRELLFDGLAWSEFLFQHRGEFTKEQITIKLDLFMFIALLCCFETGV